MSRDQLCVVGSFMMDLIAYADRRPVEGETLVGTDFIQSPGGKGFNQAVAGARSGAPTAMVGCVGRDAFGDQFVTALEDEGVDASGVLRHPEVGTGVGMPIVSKDGSNAIIIIPRANRALTVEDIRPRADVFAHSAVVLLQLELAMACTVEAARLAHGAGAKVILNPAPYADLPDEVFQYVDLFIPNEPEAAAWLGVEGGNGAHLDLVLERAAATDTTVILTLGSRGVCVVEPGKEPVLVPAHSVEATDTIGAGDAFCGYLAGRLAQGAGLLTATREANAAAAITVTRRGGAACPTRAEVDAFCSQHDPNSGKD